MNTNKLKIFAAEARRILINGVTTKLNYWGFDRKGNAPEQPTAVAGGYVFRDQIFNDETVPVKWLQLQKAIRRHGFDDVAEQAAYTWFNRFTAIRILEKNGYEEPTVAYLSANERSPKLLADAAKGNYRFLQESEKLLIAPQITQFSKEEENFGILIKAFCRNHPLLSRVFGRMYDYSELLLPDNLLQQGGFLDLLNFSDSITDADYREVELIGWLYQFYISEKKDEVFRQFKQNKKAEAEDIPAATQIFTPRWIVRYMTENTIGRQWLDLNPDSPLRAQMKYLVQPAQSQPASQAIISEAAQLSLLDPACGSGHILVEGFDLLMQMFKEEGYTPRQAAEHILQHNLFGLDIDLRAVQLARFAVLLKAASYYKGILQTDIIPQIFAMPEPAEFTRQEKLDFLGTDFAELEMHLDSLLHHMNDAQNIGSALKLKANQHVTEKLNHRLQLLLASTEPEALQLGKKIRHHIAPALLLTRKYTAVAANPPYMGQGNMNTKLKDYINTHYPISKSDLMTVFMEVCIEKLHKGGIMGMINMPSWMFLSTFEELRKNFITNYQINSLLHMGRGIFGIDFGSSAFIVKKEQNVNSTGKYFRLHERNFQHIYYQDIEKLFLKSNQDVNYKYDFSLYRDDEGTNEIPETSCESGLKLAFPNISQSNFIKIPGSPIAYWVSEKVIELFYKSERISEYYISGGRIKTHNNEKYLRCFWEINFKNIGRNKNWLLVENGGDYRKWYGNVEEVVDWSNKAKQDYSSHGGLSNEKFWGKSGITWSIISSKSTTFRLKQAITEFTSASPVLFQTNEIHDIYILSFLNTKFVSSLIKVINPTVNTSVGDITCLPIILSEHRSQDIDVHGLTCIEISRNDWDSRETSWDFAQSPLLKYKGETLESSYLAWEKAASEDFFQLHQNEEELNRIFIEIYGLEDELTPNVPLKDITILQDELNRQTLEENEAQILQTFRTSGWQPGLLPISTKTVMEQFISYAMGCFVGRYRVGTPGLHIAHPGATEAELAPYALPAHFAETDTPFEIDDDGIVPLMDKDAAFPDNALLRFRKLVQTIWGESTLTANLNFIEQALGKNLETYFVKDFAAFHYRTYKKCPIYWVFSSDKGAFQVLAYMHRFTKYTAQKVRMLYLLKHMDWLQSQIEYLSKTATLSTTDQRKLETYKKQYDECREYDKKLEETARQQIEFDLDDGVKQNYAKFESVLLKIK